MQEPLAGGIDDGQRLEELLSAVSALPENERETFLRAQCGPDDRLRAEVQSLLAYAARAEPFLAEPTFARTLRHRPSQTTPPADAAQPDSRVERMVRAARPEHAGQAGDDLADTPSSAPLSITGYEVIRELHRGGQGVVYQAVQKSTKRKVAIKVLLEGAFASASARKRFEREVDVVAQLKHPNIITVFDSGTTADGRQFFAMDYVRGVSLHDYVRDNQLALEQTLALFGQICAALQYAHQKGVIHRDLKPGNILVDSDGIPRVLDFGLAKQAGPVETVVSMTGLVVGTLPYMSPEQARGNPDHIDTRTDVYALGVILYELLTGSYPYSVVGELDDVLRNIKEAPPTPPSRAWRPGTGISARQRRRGRSLCPIDDETQTILLKSLAKQRERRYQSAGELARDIAHYLAGEPIEAKRDSGWYVLKKTVQRYRLAATIVTAFALMMTVSAVALWVMFHAEKRERERAEAQTIAADQARRAEGQQRALAEFQAYLGNIAFAEASLTADEPARVRARLDACPVALRGWEWRYLDARSDRSLSLSGPQPSDANPAPRSPDGARVVTFLLHDMHPSACPDPTAQVCDAIMGTELAVLRGHRDWVNSAAFSPDSARVVTTSRDQTARIWNAATGAELITLRGHTDEVSSAVFSPDGTRVVTASSDKTARLWDAASGKELSILRGHEASVGSAVFSPDGARIFTDSADQTRRIWDAGMREEITTLRGHEEWVEGAGFSPDGQRILTASHDKTARIWDAATGQELAKLEGHASRVCSAVFSPNGQRIVTASPDKTARVWDAGGTLISVLSGHEDRLVSARFSADSTRIVTASYDKSARLWDAVTGAAIRTLTGHENAVYQGAFSPDGTRIVTVSLDRTARIWDSTTGQQVGLVRWPENFLHSVAFNREGTRVVSASSDKTARVWEVATGTEIAALRGHESWVNAAAFSPDGSRIVTASYDRTARVWDAQTGTEFTVLRGHEDFVTFAAFSSDGTRIVTASADKTARIWDTVPYPERFRQNSGTRAAER